MAPGQRSGSCRPDDASIAPRDAGSSIGRRAVASAPARWRRLLLAGFATAAALPATASGVVEVAAGVHALVADLGDVTPANEGVVGNVGFIVGARGVLVVDAGVSYRFGRRLLATIASTTPLPVRVVVLTDPIQEFHFGAPAFQDQGVPVLAHRDAAALIAERCETCLRRLRAALGDTVMAGSRVVVPDRLIDATTTIDLGGREVDLLVVGHGSAPGNVAVFDRTSRVLFAGGLVSIDRVPRLRDGDLAGWIAALERLDALDARIVVPGHGPVVTRVEARRTLDYLRALEQRVTALYARNVGLATALDEADLPAFRGWSLYTTLHRENVQTLWLRLEHADLREDER